MENLFDIFDLSDIPSDLGDIKKDEMTNEILDLFQMAGRELSIDEVTVAYYRKFTLGQGKPLKNKTHIMNKLYKLGKDPTSPIESVKGKKGVYKLEQNRKEINNIF